MVYQCGHSIASRHDITAVMATLPLVKLNKATYYGHYITSRLGKAFIYGHCMATELGMLSQCDRYVTTKQDIFLSCADFIGRVDCIWPSYITILLSVF